MRPSDDGREQELHLLAVPLLGEGGCSEKSGCGALTIDAQLPASGAVATADGTVTSWSVLDANAHPGYSVNVVRKNPDGTYTATASSAEVTPAESVGVQTFSTNLPIHAGEYIELNFPDGGRFALLDGFSEAASFESGVRPAVGKVAKQSPSAGKSVPAHTPISFKLA